jgi:hypothetical protein
MKLPHVRRLSIVSILIGASVSAGNCYSQENQHQLMIKVDQKSSGPFAGQRGSLCLRVYASGRITLSEWSTAAGSTVDKAGKETRSETTVNLEYSFPREDLYRMSELEEFLTSKAVQKLPATFARPHRPVDFFETSEIQITHPSGRSKKISVPEYYAASLVERTKYPSVLLILMDQLARLEDEVTEKGKPAEPSADCALRE